MKERTQASVQGTRHKPYALMLLCSYALILITGCGEKEPPSVKQSRAIAAENIELKKQLNRNNARIENLKEQYDKELDKQQKLLEKCKQERDRWKAKSQRNVRDQVKDVLDNVMAENAKLREENEKLKDQIRKLRI